RALGRRVRSDCKLVAADIVGTPFIAVAFSGGMAKRARGSGIRRHRIDGGQLGSVAERSVLGPRAATPGAYSRRSEGAGSGDPHFQRHSVPRSPAGPLGRGRI